MERESPPAVFEREQLGQLIETLESTEGSFSPSIYDLDVYPPGMPELEAPEPNALVLQDGGQGQSQMTVAYNSEPTETSLVGHHTGVLGMVGHQTITVEHETLSKVEPVASTELSFPQDSGSFLNHDSFQRYLASHSTPAGNLAPAEQEPRHYASYQGDMLATRPGIMPSTNSADALEEAIKALPAPNQRGGQAPGPLQRSDTVDVNALNDYPGELSFRVDLAPSCTGVKVCHSSMVNTTYCQPHHTMEMRVCVSDWSRVTGNTHVRVCPVFTSPQYRKHEVTRCHHCTIDTPTDPDRTGHYVQLENSRAWHGRVGRRRVCGIALQAPTGQDFFSLLLRLTCRTACLGGPNRRPTALLIQLMEGGLTLGRRLLPVKCCQAPARDLRHAETQAETKARKDALLADANVAPGPEQLPGQALNQVRNRSQVSSSSTVVSKKRKLPQLLFRTDSDTDSAEDTRPLYHGMVMVRVPLEILPEVQDFVAARARQHTDRGVRMEAGDGEDIVRFLERYHRREQGAVQPKKESKHK